jgi:hypothetical protein
MTCAINQKSMAHQWRKPFAPSSKVALREKQWRIVRAIAFSPMAQLWRNSALVALKMEPVAGSRNEQMKQVVCCRCGKKLDVARAR